MIRRLSLLAAVLALLYAAFPIGYHAVAWQKARAGEAPAVTDFITYYAVSLLLRDAPAADAYDVERLYPFERRAIDGAWGGDLGEERLDTIKKFGWYYPPILFLAVLPLALLPYLAAHLAWVCISTWPYMAAVRRAAGIPAASLLALGFPAVAMNWQFGQNGLLTAGLLGLGLAYLPTRPLLAGVFLGLLAYKPHFGLLLPLALAAGGHWRTFVSAAVTVLGLVAVTAALFGAEAWQHFFAASAMARGAMESGHAAWTLMPSAFGAIKVAGGGNTLAYAVQAISSLAAVLAVIWAWRRPGPFGPKAAVLCIAVLMLTPFLYSYDLAILAPALAWLLADMTVSGQRRPGEMLVVTAAVLLPFAVSSFARSGFQPGPWVLAALLGYALVRVARPARA